METQKIGIVYIAKNRISNKSYIGQTIKTLKDRIKGHYNQSKIHPNRKFYKALLEYSKDDWSWGILYKNIPINLLDTAEICAIYTHDTYCSGYNSTLGGDENPMKGKKHSEKVIQKLSEINSGKNNPMFGRKHSKETKIKIGLSSSKRRHSEETKRKIGISSGKANKGKKRTLEQRKKIL